jgi:hypothetical protein
MQIELKAAGQKIMDMTTWHKGLSEVNSIAPLESRQHCLRALSEALKYSFFRGVHFQTMLS